jgi:hypothetical protein
MPVIPKFDQAFWYSGFDGYLFAELLPAQSTYWFISILSGKYFVSSDISIPDRRVIPFLQSHKFRFLQATWQCEKFSSFSQNPFLALAPPPQAIALCQAGIQPLPQSLQSSSIKVFKKNQHSKSTSAYIYFIVTEDCQYLKIGFSKNPSSRLAELQASRPQALIYMGSFTSNKQRFEDICQKFEHLLVRNGWFDFTPELQEYTEILLSQK